MKQAYVESLEKRMADMPPVTKEVTADVNRSLPTPLTSRELEVLR
jgi:hypothetical protein